LSSWAFSFILWLLNWSWVCLRWIFSSWNILDSINSINGSFFELLLFLLNYSNWILSWFFWSSIDVPHSMNIFFHIKVTKWCFNITIKTKVWDSISSWVNSIVFLIPAYTQFMFKSLFRILNVVLSVKNFTWKTKIWNWVVSWVFTIILLSKWSCHFMF